MKLLKLRIIAALIATFLVPISANACEHSRFKSKCSLCVRREYDSYGTKDKPAYYCSKRECVGKGSLTWHKHCEKHKTVIVQGRVCGACERKDDPQEFRYERDRQTNGFLDSLGIRSPQYRESVDAQTKDAILNRIALQILSRDADLKYYEQQLSQPYISETEKSKMREKVQVLLSEILVLFNVFKEWENVSPIQIYY